MLDGAFARPSVLPLVLPCTVGQPSSAAGFRSLVAAGVLTYILQHVQRLQPAPPQRGDHRYRPRHAARLFTDLPEFPPRHRIGIKQRGLILRPACDGPAIVVVGTVEPCPARRPPKRPALPAQQCPCRQARLVAVEGGAATAVPDPRQRVLGAGEAWRGRRARQPWSYYSMRDGLPLLHGGLVIAANGVRTNFSNTLRAAVRQSQCSMRRAAFYR